MTTPESCRPRFLLFALPGLVVGIVAGGIAWRAGFDGLYGQDPFAYYDYAVGPLRESLSRGSWPPPFFWPPGYPLLVAPVMALVGATPASAQLVSLAAGTAVPMLTAWLCRELLLAMPEPEEAGVGGQATGHQRDPIAIPVLAGLLAGFSPQLWQWSVMVMADTTALASATLGAAALARYVRTGRGRWLSLAAGALAWAVLTRWALALVALPAAACTLIAFAGRPRGAALRHACAAAAVAAIGLAPVVPSLAAYLTGTAQRGVPFIGDLQVIGWQAENLLRREFATFDGHLRFRLPNAVYYSVIPARWFFFTPLLAPFIIPGCLAVLRARATAPLLLLLAWPAVSLVFLAGMANQNPRFALPCLPPLAILLAVGVRQTMRHSGRHLRTALAVVLVAGLAWMAVGGVRLIGTFTDRKADHMATVHWTEARVPPGARLITFGLTQTFEFYSRLEILNLFALGPQDLADAAAAGPTFLLLDVADIEDQWRERAPGENYRWLRDGPGLVEIDRRRDVTLFRVSP